MKNSKLYSLHAWVIWALGASFFLSEYFARVAPSVMVPDLMGAFHVNALALGALSAFFYYAYVGMQLPVGVLVDRYGPRRLLSITALLCGLGTILFGLTQSLHAAELGRFLMGVGAAFAFVGTLKLASVWFPHNRFAFFAGITQALGMLGAAIGEGPLAVLVGHVGWRKTMWIIGIFLMVLSILIALIVRNSPKHHQQKSQSKKVVNEFTVLQALGQVLKNPQSWVNGAVAGFLYAPTAAFAELWGVSYLSTVHDLSRDVAATAVSMIFIGWAIGSPIAGYISDRIKRRKPIIYFSIFLSAFFMSIVLYVPNLNPVMIMILLFFYGMSNIAVATTYAVACEINPRPVAGTSMSFANMSSVIVGAGFQPLIGFLLDLKWDRTLVNGIPKYTAANFEFAMFALPICFAVCFIVSLFLKESYNYHYYDKKL